MAQGVRLGFSTSTLYECCEAKEAVSLIRGTGCRVVELGFWRPEKFFTDQLEKIERGDLEGFEYVSFHAPKLNYGNDGEARSVLRRISRFHEAVRRLDLVVFHPDTVRDFGVFSDVGFSVGFENMDHRKESCRSVGDVALVLSRNPRFKLVLDMKHVYLNDPTMGLAKAFYGKLGDRIAEIHLGGFLKRPLFESGRLETIGAIQDPTVPIIVESVLTPETIGREREYILKNIRHPSESGGYFL